MAHTFPGEPHQAGAGREPGSKLVIGGYSVQVGPGQNAVVNLTGADRPAEVQPRPSPVMILPARFPGLLDREAELSAAAAALPARVPLEFYGPPGIGKTSLLRHLARHPAAASFPDGTVYLAGRGALDDLLYELYSLFYASDSERPGAARQRLALREKRFMLLLDEVELSREETLELLDTLPGSALILASQARRLYDEGQSISLAGLPVEAGQLLVSRELGHPLNDEEQLAAQNLCTGLEGNPLMLMQAAALARDGRRSLAELAKELPTGGMPEALRRHLLASLSQLEAQVVAAVASLDGAPVDEEHLSLLLELPQITPVLNGLIRRKILQAHSPQYTLAGNVADFVQAAWDLTVWKDRMLELLASWAARTASLPARLLDAVPAIQNIARWAASNGRWDGLLRLVMAAEGVFALSGRWGAWKELLEWGTQAAQALDNDLALAWLEHQSGTLALLQGDSASARQALVHSLRLREALGDTAGEAVTRHNLGVLFGGGEVTRRQGAAPTQQIGWRPAEPAAMVPVTAAFPPVPRPAPDNFNPIPWVIAGLLASALIVPIIILAVLFFSRNGGGGAIGNLPTATLTLVTTATSTATPSPTGTASLIPTRTPCGAPPNWPIYVVQPTDTLASIALTTGTTEGQLMLANCMSSSALTPGRQLFVPRLPVLATPSPTRTVTLTPTPTPSQTPVTPRPPDLVVTVLQPGTYVNINANGDFVLPLRVVVLNQGGSPAGSFKVSVGYRPTSGQVQDYLAPFQVPGESDPYYPYSRLNLPAGSQVTFDGVALISPKMQGQVIAMWAAADSCVGETFPPPACRVVEGNEGNNFSSASVLQLPVLNPPSRTPTPTNTPTPTSTATLPQPPSLTPTPTDTRQPPASLTPTPTETRQTPQGPTGTPMPTQTPLPGLTCLDFDDLSLGMEYRISEVITTSGVKLTVTALQSGVTATPDVNFARVELAVGTGSTGYEIYLNGTGLNLVVDPLQLDGLAFQYADTGDILSVAVNNEARTLEDFGELHGQSVGGASAVVFDPEGDGTGTVDFSGPITSFEVGGQSLRVDHLCLRRENQQPESSFLNRWMARLIP